MHVPLRWPLWSLLSLRNYFAAENHRRILSLGRAKVGSRLQLFSKPQTSAKKIEKKNQKTRLRLLSIIRFKAANRSKSGKNLRCERCTEARFLYSQALTRNMSLLWGFNDLSSVTYNFRATVELKTRKKKLKPAVINYQCCEWLRQEIERIWR